MSDRITRSDLETRLKSFCAMAGVPYGPDCNYGPDSLNLDVTSDGVTKRYRVEKNVRSGGTSNPFGYKMHSARDLHVMLGFAMDALSLASLAQDA